MAIPCQPRVFQYREHTFELVGESTNNIHITIDGKPMLTNGKIVFHRSLKVGRMLARRHIDKLVKHGT